MQKVPDYFAPALQGLVHWINYKKQYYFGYSGPDQEGLLLPEAALSIELAQLLSAKISSDDLLACEMFYSASRESKKRVDIAVLKRGSKDRLEGAVFIELKRATSNRKNPSKYINYIEKDFNKLSEFLKYSPSVRAFQLIIGQTDLPDFLFNENLEMKRKPLFKNELHEARPRLTKRSFETKRVNKAGAFATLIEIIPRKESK